MKALSLSRPWGWAILHLGKRIENRQRRDGRMPSLCRHRGPLLLHAAKSWDKHAEQWIEEHDLDDGHGTLLRTQNAHPAGVVFARCTVIGTIHPHGSGVVDDGTAWPPEGIDLRWHMRAQYGLILADVEPTPLVPCKGALGLWTVPEHVLMTLALASTARETLGPAIGDCFIHGAFSGNDCPDCVAERRAAGYP